jgi:hypothetical protein
MIYDRFKLDPDVPGVPHGCLNEHGRVLVEVDASTAKETAGWEISERGERLRRIRFPTRAIIKSSPYVLVDGRMQACCDANTRFVEQGDTLTLEPRY